MKGAYNGTLSVYEGGQVIVTDRANASTTIYPGANVVIEPLGKISGSTSNNGTLIITGALGGAYRGHGVLILAGEGYIKKLVSQSLLARASHGELYALIVLSISYAASLFGVWLLSLGNTMRIWPVKRGATCFTQGICWFD
ncbi:hypothetical protein [Pseudomonas sp. TUM22785]|uniref:hypothetical protein n=1 Tax=Pseudomonas sp. TUM22785 TaxID=3019098 RepID=UPI0023052341|nr:hypothetical protein [Pseudomonas sp. TUM22785]WCD78266.1 hypothetical protein PI990_19925 [Pseudomonas sp. TUM22785]